MKESCRCRMEEIENLEPVMDAEYRGALRCQGLGTMWGEEKAKEMLTEAGFANVEVKHRPEDFVNSYYIATKG